jgi:hypothetical protein
MRQTDSHVLQCTLKPLLQREEIINEIFHRQIGAFSSLCKLEQRTDAVVRDIGDNMVGGVLMSDNSLTV